jgi:hypothetical protein
MRVAVEVENSLVGSSEADRFGLKHCLVTCFAYVFALSLTYQPSNWRLEGTAQHWMLKKDANYPESSSQSCGLL